MAIGAFLPILVFVAIAGSVGIRLMALWRRTRCAPERSLGGGLVLLTLAMPLTAIGRVPALAMQPVGRVCFALGLLAVGVGLCLVMDFNRIVFRRRRRWAVLLVTSFSIAVFGSIVFMSFSNFTGESVEAVMGAMRPATVTLMVTILASFVWGTAESFACRASALRRLEIGLSDPIAVNRFLLWGLSSAACSLLLGVLVACALAGMVILREPFALSTITACGIVVSSCWYLTFFTPERYRALIGRRARERATSRSASAQSARPARESQSL